MWCVRVLHHISRTRKATPKRPRRHDTAQKVIVYDGGGAGFLLMREHQRVDVCEFGGKVVNGENGFQLFVVVLLL